MFRTADHQSAAVAAVAMVVCLATLSWVVAGARSARSDHHVSGYVVVRAAGTPVPAVPTGGTVTLIPSDPSLPTAPTTPDTADSPLSAPAPAHATRLPGPTAATHPRAGRTTRPAATGAPLPPSPRTGVRPAHLTVGPPQEAAGDRRWCEKVTVTFGNTGERPTTPGLATFVTHVVDLLGIDWTTYRTTVDVPGPIAGGGHLTRTYDICLDPWQVPPGTRMETGDVTLRD